MDFESTYAEHKARQIARRLVESEAIEPDQEQPVARALTGMQEGIPRWRFTEPALVQAEGHRDGPG